VDAVAPPEHKDDSPAAEHCRCNPRNHDDRKSSPSLPALDVGMLAAQDVGQQTPKGDKSPFQLEAGLYFGVPLQRRQATGQVRTSEGEMAQIAAKERYAADRVVADVQFAFTGLTTSYDELQQARRGVELALRMEQAERERFDRGDSNILFIQLREQATADAQLLVVEAIGEYHVAAAEYRAALGIDAQGGP
jgi:outer membrane protein TolC